MKQNNEEYEVSLPQTPIAEGGAVAEASVRAPKRRRRRMRWREWLILTIPMVAAVIAVLVALLATEEEFTYRLPDKGYQYYAGAAATVSQGAELKVTEDGQIIFADNGNPTTLPIYLESSRSFVVTADLIYYMPRDFQQGRVVSFSEIECRESGMIYLKKDNQTLTPDAGFLYDGKDFYLFLEPMLISYMGYEIEVPALSYAEVRNGGDIMIFNYETKEFIVDTLEGSATAQTLHGEYTISLLGDSMTKANGMRILLMTRPELLDPIE